MHFYVSQNKQWIKVAILFFLFFHFMISRLVSFIIYICHSDDGQKALINCLYLSNFACDRDAKEACILAHGSP